VRMVFQMEDFHGVISLFFGSDSFEMP